MKSCLGAVIGLLVAVLVAYGVWVQFPKLNNPTLATSIYTRVTAKHSKISRDVNNPSLNGFLQPDLSLYWGRRGKAYRPGSKTESIVKTWNQYSTPANGALVDHKSLQKSQDNGYQKAQKDFEPLAAKIRSSVEKPIFFPPKNNLDAEAVIPNFIGIRAYAQALVGLSEARVAQGRIYEAADNMVVAVEFGNRTGKSGGLMAAMIGVAVQRIGLDGLTGLIDPQTPITAPQWEELSQRLLDSISPADALQNCLEWELTANYNTVQKYKAKSGSSNSLLVGKVDWLPGYLAREERILVNTMTDQIDELVRTGTVTSRPYLNTPSYYDWFSGRTGQLAQMLVSEPSRAQSHLELARVQLETLATAYAILGYKARTGEFPETLSLLRNGDQQFDLRPGAMEAMTYTVEGKSALLRRRFTQPTPNVRWLDYLEWGCPWAIADPKFFQITLGPRNDP